jgi:transketolase
METFGASATLNELQKRLGFEPGRIVATATELLAES